MNVQTSCYNEPILYLSIYLLVSFAGLFEVRVIHCQLKNIPLIFDIIFLISLPVLLVVLRRLEAFFSRESVSGLDCEVACSFAVVPFSLLSLFQSLLEM